MLNEKYHSLFVGLPLRFNTLSEKYHSFINYKIFIFTANSIKYLQNSLILGHISNTALANFNESHEREYLNYNNSNLKLREI